MGKVSLPQNLFKNYLPIALLIMPAGYFSSVSIICESSALADALSTALFCMSEADGHALVSEIGGCEAMWITPDGEITSTLGFEEFVK